MGPTDDEIRKQEIIDQLIWDDSVDANDVFVSVRSGIAELTPFKRNSIDDKKINVSVKNGVVNLTGIVRNHFTKRQAYNIAMYTTGVVDVVDDIVIAWNFHTVSLEPPFQRLSAEQL